jgi:tetratricopeptide (TPR) repeat protein
LILVLCLFLATAGLSGAAEQGQLDSSPALFSVLAAINAVGYDADVDSPSNSPWRAKLRAHLAANPPACLGDLKRFFRDHKQKSGTAELSQYMSFALATEGPPSFQFRFKEYLLPPDVQALEGFQKLMTRFHQEARIDDLYRLAQPEFEAILVRYHEPVSRAVLEVNGYLRNATSGYLGRRFQIYVDLLGAPNQVFSRSYGDDFFVVVTPSPEPQVDYIRHSYLHFLLDPLSIKYGEQTLKKKSLEDFALGAPALDESFKNDFLLLVTESLIKAVEARLAPAAKRAAMVDEALKEGYILAPFFSEQLPLYEKNEQTMRLFYPDMIAAIDLKKESKRLDQVEFARERVLRTAKQAVAPPPVEKSVSEKALDEAESYYRSKEYARAREAYLKVLQQTEEKSAHAKSYYGLARIAALEKNPELAEKMFQRTLELNPDSQTKAMAHLYLGRLADAAGDRAQATGHYQAVLAIAEASKTAREAAQQGLQRGFKKDQ